MVAWHGICLLKQVRRALPSRFGVTIRFYIVAALLPLGAAFGALLHRAHSRHFTAFCAGGAVVTLLRQFYLAGPVNSVIRPYYRGGYRW